MPCMTAPGGASARIKLISVPQPAATTTPVSSRRAADAAQAEDEQHGGERAQEGIDGHQRGAEPEEHGQQRRGGRAARHAEHVGVGQGIAQQHLKKRPGQREQPAHCEGGDGARQPQLPNEQRRGAAVAGERREQAQRRGHEQNDD